MESHKKMQELISDGERRMKVLSSMGINLVARSPFIDSVMEFLKSNPDSYNQAITQIDTQKDNLNKIRVTIECLKKLDRSRKIAGRLTG